MRTHTRLVHYDPCPGDPWRPNTTPLYQTATFAGVSASESGVYDYTRSGNPTRDLLQRQVADLEGGGEGFAFSSGMAAIAAVTRLCQAGEHIICGRDIYGGTFRWLDSCAPRLGLEVTAIDAGDPEALAKALRPETRLVMVETPTNPLQEINDIEALAEVSRAHGAWFVVDGTLMSPYLQRPHDLGADVVLHSATKHLSGHGDCTAGVVVTRDAAIAERLAFQQNAEGTGLAPFESWLLLRGMKTLGVRLDREQVSAGRVAEFLSVHPLVTRVYYPGLEEHPGADVHRRQARGAGSLISFTTGDLKCSRRVVEETRLFTISVSFGSTSSSISLPACMSHASIPEEVRKTRALPGDLVRLSIGLEDPEDLIEDLARSLDEDASPHSKAWQRGQSQSGSIHASMPAPPSTET